MRKPLVAGNWKMNLYGPSAMNLAKEIESHLLNNASEVEVMIAPPAPYLSALSSAVNVNIGAQDVSSHIGFGAYTGEFNASMLKSIGVNFAIVGHSERRAFHGEDDTLISKKIGACIEADIVPVYCCGESLDERESGRHFEVVKNQITTALDGYGADQLRKLVVAYEPVWAIGTGKTASAEQAQDMHAEIRSLIREMLGNDFAENVRILYGGSCKPDNAASIFGQEDVDGGLIGGAALKAEDFMAIIHAAG
jgi:triosephosphate isomerase